MMPTVDPFEAIQNFKDKNTPDTSRLRLRSYAGVSPRNAVWYEKYWLPMKGLTGLAGPPGVGKSTFFVDEIAKLTKGEYEERDPVSVIYFTEEESREEVIVLRLMAAGADMSRVMILDKLSGFEDEEVEVEINLKADLEKLEHALQSDPEYQDIRAIYLDPVVSFLGINESKDGPEELRKQLVRLSKFADRNNVLIRMLKHTKKTQANSDKIPTEDLIFGLTVWKEVPRSFSILWPCRREGLRENLGIDPDNEVNVIMLRGKNNAAPADLPAKAFKLGARDITIKGETFSDVTYLEHLGALDVTDDSFNEANSKTKEETRQDRRDTLKIDDAVKEAILFSHGRIAKQDLYTEIIINRCIEVSKMTVDRSAKRIGLEVESIEGGDKNAKQWIIPNDLLSDWKEWEERGKNGYDLGLG